MRIESPPHEISTVGFGKPGPGVLESEAWGMGRSFTKPRPTREIIPGSIDREFAGLLASETRTTNLKESKLVHFGSAGVLMEQHVKSSNSPVLLEIERDGQAFKKDITSYIVGKLKILEKEAYQDMHRSGDLEMADAIRENTRDYGRVLNGVTKDVMSALEPDDRKELAREKVLAFGMAAAFYEDRLDRNDEKYNIAFNQDGQPFQIDISKIMVESLKELQDDAYLDLISLGEPAEANRLIEEIIDQKDILFRE